MKGRNKEEAQIHMEVLYCAIDHFESYLIFLLIVYSPTLTAGGRDSEGETGE